MVLQIMLTGSFWPFCVCFSLKWGRLLPIYLLRFSLLFDAESLPAAELVCKLAAKEEVVTG